MEPPQSDGSETSGQDRQLSPTAREQFEVIDAPLEQVNWRARVAQLYRELSDELEGTEHYCALSGRCCNFPEMGHTLFATGVEVQYAAEAGIPVRNGDPSLCPFWYDSRCYARDERPLGCRTYYCHSEWGERGQVLYEKYHRALKEVTAQCGPYSYQSWPTAIRAALDARETRE